MPAPAFEDAVATAIADHLAMCATGHRILRHAEASNACDVSKRVQVIADTIRQGGASAAAALIAHGAVNAGTLSISLDPRALEEMLDLAEADLDPGLLEIVAPFTCRRRGAETKIIAGERQPTPDLAMIRALRNAHRWAYMLKSGIALREIAHREGVSESYVARIIPLATLSPKIQDAILAGNQPLGLSLETLVRSRIPLCWDSQEKRFGLAA